MSALVGTLLSGRYRLDAQVGSGGMSTVYRAFDSTLERRVAIKLMHRDIAADTDQLERFRREARAVAQLSHPHIVGVIDAGEEDGRPYIVFEYVEGEIYANVWYSDRIARVDPRTGLIAGWLDGTPLRTRVDLADPREDVLNGIAYERDAKKLYVTGKRWPKVFEVEVTR